jgi:flagellar basal-body rod protein FlgG
MLALISKQDVIANNLANVNTTGFKRDYASLRSFSEELVYAMEGRPDSGYSQTPIGTLSSGVGIGETGFINTNALSGDGFFAVSTPTGERYTRNGNFNVDGLGRLVDQDGNFVLGESGPVAIDGNDVVIDEMGRVFVDTVQVDTLRIRGFDSDELRKVGDNLFVASTQGRTADAVVKQRYLEGSNVDVVGEMVEMMATSRSFEANQRILKSQDEMLGRAVNDVGRIG